MGIMGYRVGERVCSGERGFVLPVTIIVSLIVLTSVGVWYRQTLSRGHLARQVVQRRALYLECGSLLPLLVGELSLLEPARLSHPARDFFELGDVDRPRWAVDRSALRDGRVVFTFRRRDVSIDPIVLTIAYTPTGG